MGKRTKKPATQRPAKASLSPGEKVPLIQHIHELRRRLFYVAACIAVGSAVAYGLEHQIVEILLRPSHGQNFIYTSPLGGMNFLFSVCLDIGLVVATPIIIYQLLAFLQPLMQNTTRKFLLIASGAAGVVAIAGVLFGYFIGLPSALHFLLHQFTTVQVRPLITIQSYMQFVALYLFGCALMFQLPLIILLINRIKPLKPSNLFKYERHLIVGAFVIAFIMNPSPNIVDQLFVVLPIIITYQLSILMLWLVHRSGKPSQLQLLREQDAQRRAERASRDLKPLTAPAPGPAPVVAAIMLDDEFETDAPIVTPTPVTSPALAANAAHGANPTFVDTPPDRPRQYAAGVSPTARRSYMPLRGQLVQ